MENYALAIATKYAARKAAIDTSNMPGWMLDTAAAMRWEMPDMEVYKNQALLYTRLSWIYSAVNTTAERCALQTFNVMRRSGEDKEDIPNHPFEMKLEKPNPRDSQLELMRDTFSYLAINGNAYWWKNATSEEQEPVEIWPIPSWRIKPLPDGNMYIAGYEYDPGSGMESVTLPTWSIMHLKGFNPLNEFVGLSQVEPVGPAANIDLASQDYQYKLMKGNARLPGILAFKDPINNPIAWERIKYDVEKAAEMRRLMLLRGVGDKVEWLKAAATNEEMQYIAMRAQNKEEIYAVFAPGYLSMISENSTEANSKAGRQTWLDVAVFPRLVAMQQKITNDILPAYGENLVGEFEDPRQTDRALELQEEEAYGKVHTINEIRKEKYNDDPLPEDDDRGDMLPAQIGQSTGMPGDEENTPPQLMPFTGQDGAPEPEEPEEETDTDDEMPVGEAMRADLARWRRKAIKALKTGNAAVIFESEAIPPELHADIWARLSACKSANDVRAVFDGALVHQRQDDEDLLYQLKRANDLLERIRSEKPQD